ncbi:MAG TPA: hypothetical protein P5164_00055 [Thermoanaerobaculia bacterium]|nr:hypothetical protein [Thermoanaerobaculia bacterium]
MLSFASLFVGLVFGIVPVKVVATAPVVRVELYLDGERVGDLREPFEARLDLGCEPAPHELVAVGYDARGRQVDRIRQWINRPRPPAEATLLLEPGSGGKERIARLSWRCLTEENPRSITVTLDDVPLAAEDPSAIALPPHDPTKVHALKAVLDFGRGVVATAEAIFGGPRRSEAFTEMTAVAVETPDGAALPPAADLTGWFESRGAPLEVAAVEEGPREVVVLSEGSALAQLRKLFRYRTTAFEPSLPEDAVLRYVWPVAQTAAQSEMRTNVYPITRPLGPGDGSLSWIAARRLDWPAWRPGEQRISDALAVAALAAADGERRRAVVLLLGPEAADASLLSPAEATEFLGHLRVPLVVWAVGAKPPSNATPWGSATPITTARQFDAAVASLFEKLGRQRIVWVEGTHLPQDVQAGALATGVRMAR